MLLTYSSADKIGSRTNTPFLKSELSFALWHPPVPRLCTLPTTQAGHLCPALAPGIQKRITEMPPLPLMQIVSP